ncbi:hypothetical protein AAFN60_00935 [Roseibacillus persicicus]|uniref:hypothetical protein n=1 Tax=Roseibacillus persicicus TaxID=454148 RepID=UPI00398B2ED8
MKTPICFLGVYGLAVSSSLAAPIVSNGSDGFGASSFASAGIWTGGLAPTAGNDYTVAAGHRLRTPPDGNSYTFAGDSLTISDGGAPAELIGLSYKGTGNTAILTVDDLILDGGSIDHISGSADVMILDGNLTIASDSLIYAKQGVIRILSPIAGSATITNPGRDAAGRALLIESPLNTFTGNLVNNGETTLIDNAVFNFVVGAPGVSNSITGTGVTTVNGDFVIDVSGASSTLGDSWTLAPGAVFGATFTVSGWTETAAGIWWDPTSTWRFTTADGLLLVAPSEDSDEDGLRDLWEDQYFGNNDGIFTSEELALQSGGDDPDGDELSNEREETALTDPNNPDSDGDGLNDGPELDGTSNALVSHGYGPTSPLVVDSDADGVNDGNEVSGALNTQNSNESTNPNAADSDGDLMTDGYELANNTPGAALDPNDISDGDLGVDNDNDGLDNYDEFIATPQTRADLEDTDGDGYLDSVEDSIGSWGGMDFTGTSPVNPDTDGDGILDGDEDPDNGTIVGLPYITDPNLADSDIDGFSDKFELEAGTSPVNGAEFPQQPAGWVLLENFEGTEMVIGETFSGRNGWSNGVEAAATVVDEPIAGGDRIGVLNHPAGIPNNFTHFYKSLSAQGLQVMADKSGTIFMQVYIPTGGVDHSVGLTDVYAPGADFGLFELQVAMRGATNLLTVRDGGGLFDTPSHPVGRWFNLWMVANNATDTVKVYVESLDGQTGVVDLTPDTNAAAPFSFRNGTTDVLSTFMIIENAPDNTPLYFDNVYIDPDNAIDPTDLEPTDKPVMDKPTPVGLVTPEITSVSFDGSGNLLLTFTPGGSGYVVTSSDDLVADFAEVTSATYDNVDTFTIPAASLAESKDFFRIEEAQ